MIPCGTIKWDELWERLVAERGIAVDRNGRTLVGRILVEWPTERVVRRPHELYPGAPFYDRLAPDRLVGIEPPPDADAAVALLVEGLRVITGPRIQDFGNAALVWLRRGEALTLERRAWLGFRRRRFEVVYEGAGDIDRFERDLRISEVGAKSLPIVSVR
jgi:hypothetical protein